MASHWIIFEEDGRQRRAAVTGDGSTIWLFLDGNTYTIRSEATGSSRRKSSGGADVMAPMPATVVAINTSVGATVHEGDTLIVLEAMKMELPIKAPKAGIIKAIACAKGELVQPGVNLIEIDSSTEAQDAKVE